MDLKGLYGSNRMWLNGVYQPFFAGKCDFMCFDVGGMNSRIDEKTGALISEIRSYKMARRLNMACEERLYDDLHCAVHMAFNRQRAVPGFGTMGGPDIGVGARVFTPLAEFFREYNDRYLTQTDNVADAAVLRSWPSMAYSIGGTLIPAILMEEVLIQHKVPFDIIFDDHLSNIAHYGAVILAGQESLSKDNVDRLLAYVRNGGTLIFTGNTAAYNERREKRARNPLLSLLASDAKRGIAVAAHGKGRLVYVPQIIPSHRTGSAGDGFEDNPEIEAGKKAKPQRFLPSEWTLPRNHQEIYRAIADHLPRGLSVRTEAPLTTVMEVLNRPVTRETILHFVNFDQEKPTVPFPVNLKKQNAAGVKSVTHFSPDVDDAKPLQFKETPDVVTFTAPATRLYAMVVVAYSGDQK
ncbi:MAG TPA: hypothetical protein VM120_17090 [Bryobacteraceae bacterium]|nr:hypothetical protein [Bryobacteraceae bacterium]